MKLIDKILTPQESVNDEFLTIIDILCKNGSFVKEDQLLAELETSKALVEVRSTCNGYVKVLSERGADVKVGSAIFELYDTEFLINTENDSQNSNSTILEPFNGSIPENTKFSKAAEIFINDNNLDKKTYADLLFVTTKDLIKEEEFSNKIIYSTEDKKNDNLKIKEISSIKKKEFDYLYSVNSSCVISRISSYIRLDSISNIETSQNFIKSTPLPLIIQEVSKLLIKYPNLNSYYSNGKIVLNDEINVGFAIDDSINGLKVASIFNSNDLNLLDIENQILILSSKYKENKLSVKEISSATFTITDLFNSGILTFHPLVNYNNSAILGVSGFNNSGFIIDLSFDHRVTSGREVSSFLNDLKFRLESRLNSIKHRINSSNDVAEILSCVKCGRNSDEDLDGKVFFQQMFNSKYNGIICSKCLIPW